MRPSSRAKPVRIAGAWPRLSGAAEAMPRLIRAARPPEAVKGWQSYSPRKSLAASPKTRDVSSAVSPASAKYRS